MTLTELRALCERATGKEWRVDKTHDLWSEIRSGYGFDNTMVADCLRSADASFIAAARTYLPLLIRIVEAQGAIIGAAYPFIPRVEFKELWDAHDAALARLEKT